MSKLQGDANSGWIKDLLPGQSSRFIIDAVNYTIPFARAIASLTGAWIIGKFTHRYSVIMALSLSALAFPLVFSPTFAVFVIGRMLMAIGGSLLIIYTQPIINTFFVGKHKGLLSTFNGLAYSSAAMILNFVFLHSDVTKYLTEQWKITASVFGALTLIPLVVYVLFGVHFDINSSKSSSLSLEPAVTYKEVLLSKGTINWIFCYSCLIVVSVAVSWEAPKVFAQLSPDTIKDMGGLKWGSIYTLMFYIGCASGMVMGVFNKKRMKRTGIVKFGCAVTAVMWTLISFMIIHFGNAGWHTTASVVSFIAIFIASFFGMGIQAVLLYIPHEYEGNTANRLSIFYSLIWGAGYFAYGVFAVIFAALMTWIPGLAWILMSTVIFAYYFFASKIQEPKPNWPIFSLKDISAKEESH